MKSITKKEFIKINNKLKIYQRTSKELIKLLESLIVYADELEQKIDVDGRITEQLCDCICDCDNFIQLIEDNEHNIKYVNKAIRTLTTKKVKQLENKQ